MSAAGLQRIVGWNIRAGGGRRADGILRQLLKWRADTIGLSEFRGTAPSQQLARDLAEAGYPHQISSIDAAAPATNALLLASREPLEAIAAPRMPRHPTRWILARSAAEPALTIGLMHVPNYTSPELKYPFLDAVLQMLDRWRLGPALLLGDTNCGKRGLDEAVPQGSRFAREHDWLIGIEQRGWADAFRHLRGNRREYTWYSHRQNGFRLDQAFASPEVAPALRRARHAWGRDAAEPGRRDTLSAPAALLGDIDLARVRRQRG